MNTRSLLALLLCIAALSARAADDAGPLKPATGEENFKPLFNGKDLTGWDGDPSFWRVEDGLITGETTKENPIKHGNTFLILKDGDKDAVVADFEFRVSFRFAADRTFGNSGIQYRSHRVQDAKNPENKWIVGGYQADCDLKNGYTGICYEERGRAIFCAVGKRMHVTEDGKKEDLGDAATPDQVKEARKPAGEWNDYVVICRGNHCTQVLNGVVVADFIDDQPGKAAASGILALQLHAGAAMKIDFRNPRIRTMEPAK